MALGIALGSVYQKKSFRVKKKDDCADSTKFFACERHGRGKEAHVASFKVSDAFWSVQNAFLKALQKLEGAFAIVMIAKASSNALYAARKGSPLIAGLGKNESSRPF